MVAHKHKFRAKIPYIWYCMEQKSGDGQWPTGNDWKLWKWMYYNDLAEHLK